MKVSDVVIGLKAAEDTGILGTIGRGNINNLKAHLECPFTLVPSQLDPDFNTGDYIMPCEPASSMYIKNTYSVCIFKTILQVVYSLLGILIQQLEHLYHQIWNIDKGATPRISSPPDFSETEKGQSLL